MQMLQPMEKMCMYSSFVSIRQFVEFEKPMVVTVCFIDLNVLNYKSSSMKSSLAININK